MASLSMQIRCGVCLNDLRDPVSIPCQHSYCRVCITRHLAVNGDENRCPECRSLFSRDDVRVNRALRNIVDAVRAHLEEHESLREPSMSTLRRPNQTSTDQCPNHFETFSLFCETDQKLICVACRRDRRHQGHRFKNLSEAFQANKLKAAERFDILVCENKTLVELIESQADEIKRTREQSKVLSDQLSEQFEQMHQFLRDKEDEVKALLLVEEDNLLERMEVNLFPMEEMLSEVKVNQGVLVSALEMDEPCQFLSEMNEKFDAFFVRPVSDVTVIRNTLFLGPYETDLKVTVCKVMLKSIQPGKCRNNFFKIMQTKKLFLINEHWCFAITDTKQFRCCQKQCKTEFTGLSKLRHTLKVLPWDLSVELLASNYDRRGVRTPCCEKTIHTSPQRRPCRYKTDNCGFLHIKQSSTTDTINKHHLNAKHTNSSVINITKSVVRPRVLNHGGKWHFEMEGYCEKGFGPPLGQ
uniref:Uncharacterized protein n=1 Tax=Pygocentrus nattereri TaxID=42514 RepID=A0AAR2KD99_PYGNA